MDVGTEGIQGQSSLAVWADRREHRGYPKKSDDAYDWLQNFYKTRREGEKLKKDVEDLPHPLRLNHPVEAVERVLSILESWEWKISIEQALDMDESWVDDVLEMKSVGEDWKRIRQEQQDALGDLPG